ncbi:MAG: flagellar hook-associated protein FlgK [Phycisphaeraceae bacterium]
MGLNTALQVGKSGLLASQTAVQVAGSNLANMATRGYHRQTVELSPSRNQELQNGVFVGRGVELTSITRQIDEALETRLRSAIADQSRSSISQDLLGQIEAIENEFSDVDLSTRLAAFFNSWSNLATNPQDDSLRALVVEEAQTLASFIQDLDGEYGRLTKQTDDAIGNAASTVNDLLSRIEGLNTRIAVQEGGQGGSGGLRDQRDSLLSELSQYLDISTVEQRNGKVDVFVGSTPIILDGKNRGVEIKTTSENGESQVQVVVGADKTPLDVSSGEIGAMIQFRYGDLADTRANLDRLASQIIWQTNRVHSQSQGETGFDSVTGAAKVADATAALSDADATGLDFTAGHGSFEVHLTQKSTGQRVSQTIRVDLDGINPGTDTTLSSLAADLDAVDNLNASVTADGRLQLDAATDDFEVSFSDDSSGVLAALGVNTFFTGGDSYDIGVNNVVSRDVSKLAAARGHVPGDNAAARAVSDLKDQSLTELDGLSITGFWNRHVESNAIALAQAREQVQADATVRSTLDEQQQAVSGVNADEETINLLQYQRGYQASARFITVVDELMQTLLSLV